MFNRKQIEALVNAAEYAIADIEYDLKNGGYDDEECKRLKTVVEIAQEAIDQYYETPINERD